MGTVNVFSWIAICAGVCILIAQMILAMVVFYNETFVIKRWHMFLIYQAMSLVVLIYNLFVLRRAEWTHNIGCKFEEITFSCYISLTELLSCPIAAVFLDLSDHQLGNCIPETAQRVCLEKLRQRFRMARRNCLLDWPRESQLHVLWS